ncbi:sirohydrochlorin chelatase [Streptomyces sp. MB09-02B]|uniref:sirohydrochlorin chelatase n=1 Tax=Streptomyces sp. MB09-02B TaxID=3028667 RepID=UPI0029BA4C6E|nr:sirohydrochlorin chelatase [Streptomyces sp. MB09-02B]MDX3642947.1 sirohydrochlorin chelatase [Streptomyces sp. MB09-02B]
MTTPPPALLIAGHGTRDDEAGAEAFRDLLRALGRRHPGLPVGGGFAEPFRPPLGEAVTALVEHGVRRFAVVPLAWEAAGRAGADVRAVLDRVRERHPEVSYGHGRPPGPSPVLLSLLERRVEEALGSPSPRTPGDRAEVTVLLVGYGSADPEANAEVHRAARLLWEGRGYAGVETAFVSPAAPDVPSGLDRCVRLGARRIVVLPYFPLDGGPADRVRQQTEGWAAARPEIEVRSADVIGPEPELLDLIVERYREALEGDPHMHRDSHDSSVLDGTPPGGTPPDGTSPDGTRPGGASCGGGNSPGLPRQPRARPDDDGHHGHDHHHWGHTHSHAH